jgi:hypothetical protein
MTAVGATSPSASTTAKDRLPHPKPTLGTGTKRRIYQCAQGPGLREKQTKGFKVIFVTGCKASLPKSPKVLLIFEQQVHLQQVHIIIPRDTDPHSSDICANQLFILV